MEVNTNFCTIMIFKFYICMYYCVLDSTMSNYYNVFVYGTLKSGEPNHHWFSKGNGHYKLLCNAQTAEKFPLIIATEYNIPFLLYSPGNKKFTIYIPKLRRCFKCDAVYYKMLLLCTARASDIRFLKFTQNKIFSVSFVWTDKIFPICVFQYF